MLLNTTNVTIDNLQSIDNFNLAMYIIIISVGLIWNGTLLFMFARHKEIRTTANIMIFNLALCDVLNLGIVAPLRYKYQYPGDYQGHIDFCKFRTILRVWINAASALSLVVLSIQRFCITVPSLMFRLGFITRNRKLMAMIYILLVWTVSLTVSLPFGFFSEIYGFYCGRHSNRYYINLVVLVFFIFYCMVLLSVIFLSNVATARRLRRSIREINGGVHSDTCELLRKRSANVVTALCLLFMFTYSPYFIWLMYVYQTGADMRSGTTAIFGYISKHFLFLNSCFNPVALYLTSSTFRKLFNRYLCCSKDREEVVSSVQCAASTSM